MKKKQISIHETKKKNSIHAASGERHLIPQTKLIVLINKKTTDLGIWSKVVGPRLGLMNLNMFYAY